jgi:hypothetical protein
MLDDDAIAGLRGEDERGDIDMRRCRSSARVSVLVESDASRAAFGVVICVDRDENLENESIGMQDLSEW